MAICSFSRVVLVLFFCLLSYYAYSMYQLFYPTQCPSNSRNKCLLPAYSSKKTLEVGLITWGTPNNLYYMLVCVCVHLVQLWVYASPKQLIQKEKMELLWRQTDLVRSTTISR